MSVPQVKVGIMNEPTIKFILNEDYSFNGEIVKGEQFAEYVDGKIKWNGNIYQQIDFTPVKEDAGTFELIDVTIGVNFHWERKENQSFKGALRLIVESAKLYAVNILSVEDYLLSVISSEMSATASLELLKAHAVISRSWLLAQIEKNKKLTAANAEYSATQLTDTELVKWYDREDHVNFDVCADDHCQRYQGITRASTQEVADAIKATWGEVVMYDGELCDARFSKCCGGVLEEFENCWEPTHYEYLEARRDGANCMEFPDLTIEEESDKWIRTSPDAFCNTVDKEILSQVLNNYDQETTDFYRWKVEYTQDEIAKLIKERSGVDYGTIIDLQPVSRGTSGRLYRMKIVGTKQTLIIGKELEIRRTLSPSHLYSSAFVVDKEDVKDGVPGKFILTGAGWGHGVGLCQIGAAVMGANGYKYKDILLHYFINASINNLY
ncbi:MAG: SpoIID/LytB domain-containing protein [Bacteroidales bacterium]